MPHQWSCFHSQDFFYLFKQVSVKEIKFYPEGVNSNMLWLSESMFGEPALAVQDGSSRQAKVSFGGPKKLGFFL